VDYKTGGAKEKLTFAEKEQLFIYQLAAVELFKQPIVGLVFYYLENNSEVEFIGKDKDLEKIKAKIISTIKEICRGEFPPKPGRICAWCDFREICEFRA
jgi:CRISPR/Cas system-associated exonuclease Cas4 (RecB family)